MNARLRMLRNAVLFVGLVALLPGCVSRMFYYPDSVAYRTPESMPGPVEEIVFCSLDNTGLHGWLVYSTNDVVHGTVVHFHGNAQNLTAHSGFVDWLPAAGFNLFMFDYRGYGRSAGRPSRHGLYLDGVAALTEVRKLPGVDTNRVFIIGQSLGGAVALDVAGRHPELAGRAMVIDSTFYSYRRIVRDKIALFPILSFLRTPLSYLLITDSHSPHAHLDALAVSSIPLLFLHGTADMVIPADHSRWLYERAGEPKRLVLIEGGRHTSGMLDQRAEIAPQIVQFFLDAVAHE